MVAIEGSGAGINRVDNYDLAPGDLGGVNNRAECSHQDFGTKTLTLEVLAQRKLDLTTLFPSSIRQTRYQSLRNLGIKDRIPLSSTSIVSSDHSEVPPLPPSGLGPSEWE